MSDIRNACWIFAAVCSLLLTASAKLLAEERGASAGSTSAPSVVEARQRALLLHETIHATLHVVHYEYYREDERLTIPAASLQKVFNELASRQKVQLRWLAVDAQPMNADHKPTSEFDRQAVQALTAGQAEFEQTEDGVYRYAGSIKLMSACLKCHAPNRTDTKDRQAGLVISVPLSAASESVQP